MGATKLTTSNYLQGATGALGMMSQLNDIYQGGNFQYTPKIQQAKGAGFSYQRESNIDMSSAPSEGKAAGSSALSMAASGASVGAALGPIGAGVGAVVGGIAGAFTGAAAARKKREQMKKEQGRITARNINNFSSGQTDYLQNEYNTNNNENQMTYMAKGGMYSDPMAMAQKPNARVDEGEVMMRPDGDMEEVENSNPNTPKVGNSGTDDHVASLEEGTKILSNKIRIPGTKTTFAEAGQKIESKLNAMKNKEPKTVIERNTMAINQSNLQKQYNDLFSKQEAIKGPKTSPSASYAKGGTVAPVVDGSVAIGDSKLSNDDFSNYPDKVTLDKYNYFVQQRDSLKSLPNQTPGTRAALNMRNDQIAAHAAVMRDTLDKMKGVKSFAKGGVVDYSNLPGYWQAGEFMTDANGNPVESNLNEVTVRAVRRPKKVDVSDSATTATGLNKITPFVPGTSEDITGLPIPQQKTSYNSQDVLDQTVSTTPSATISKDNTADNSGSGYNWGDVANVIPSIMNIAKSFDKTQNVESITPESMISNNPYESQILKNLKGKRERLQPYLDKNTANANIARYNARQSGTGGRAYDVATTAAKMRADQDAVMNVNKINDSHMTDYTNALQSFGNQRAQQMAAAKQYASQYNLKAQDMNNQSDAARQNLLGAGIKGISDYNQMKQLTRKKDSNDQRTLDMMEKYYKNFTNNPLFTR